MGRLLNLNLIIGNTRPQLAGNLVVSTGLAHMTRLGLLIYVSSGLSPSQLCGCQKRS